MVETSDLNKNLYFFDMMYLFLIIMEITNTIKLTELMSLENIPTLLLEFY